MQPIADSFSLGVRRPIGRSAVATAPVGLLARLLFAAGLIFLFPAFTYQLAMDAAGGRFVGSEILKIVTVAIGLFGLGMVMSSREATRTVVQCWPMLLLAALAVTSTAWSIDPQRTLQFSFTLSCTTIFGLALVTRLPRFECIRFVIRVMALGCALSIAWVVIFPDTAVHQPTDLFQTVHAGLWRGIFSHKQGLGLHAGLTAGLLFYYRSRIFPVPTLVIAIACAVACLVGTQSATGMVAAVTTPAIFLLASWTTTLSPRIRRLILTSLAVFIVLFIAAYVSGWGSLYAIPRLLGKSGDLTGRTDWWPVLLDGVWRSDRMLQGGGYATAFAERFVTGIAVDSGFVDKILEFGYGGAAVVFGIYTWILAKGIRLIMQDRPRALPVSVFPYCIMVVLLIVNITESNFMLKHISTIFICMATGLIVQERARGSVKQVSARGPAKRDGTTLPRADRAHL